MRFWWAGVLSWMALCGEPAAAENLLTPVSHKQWDEGAVRHLLRRAGFEGLPEEVQRLAAMSPAEAVDDVVDFDKLPQPELDLQLDPKLSEPEPREWIRSLDEETRQRYNETRRMAERLQLERIRAWWLERMVTSPRQLEEVMTLFWHGHFTSGFREVRRSYLLYEQNQLLRKHALGNYRELLLAISSDPAMLIYLDSFRNTKKEPNENFARELMELFTLGEGHYTEQDVKEAARAFTGWSIEDGEFKLRKRQHDFGSKTFMGREGPWNGGDIIDIILQQPQSQRFIVTRLWEHFCFDDPDYPTVEGLAETLRRNKFEIRPVVRQILMSEGFYSERSRGTKIKGPVELVAGTLRLTGARDIDYLAANQALAAMGQELFQPPNVKGWDGDEKWISTATVFNRYNFAGAAVNGQSGQSRPGLMMRMGDAAAEFGFLAPIPRKQVGLPPCDPSRLVKQGDLETPETLVDALAGRMLAVGLPPDQRQQLIGFLGGEVAIFDDRNSKHADRVRTLIHLLMSTPEYQVK